MATTSSPYGFVGLKRVGEMYNTQGFTSEYTIASGYGTDILFGDPVLVNATGTIERIATTNPLAAFLTVGIFLGCEYTTPNLNYRVQAQSYPANTVGTGINVIKAYILTDPQAVFEIQADGPVAATALNSNAGIAQPTLTDPFGKSRIQLDASSVADTATLPLKIVGFVSRPDSVAGDAFTDCLVKINTDSHQLDRAAGQVA